MAYFIMPAVGEPVTCDIPCEHKDCQFVRELTTTPCDLCGKTVEAGRPYVLTENHKPRHYRCHLENAGL